ncbi:tyrosine-type recombinase/integrase [Myxococcus sp. 1LA]
MAHVRKIGKKWYATWVYEDGHPREKVTAARTKSEALVFAQGKEREAWRQREGLEVAPADVTLAVVYTEQYRPLVMRLADPTTTDGRWRNHILPELGSLRLRKIRPEDISALLRSKLRDEDEDDEDEDEVRRGPGAKGEGLGPQTVRHLRAHLHAFFAWATKEAHIYVGENPAALSWNPDLDEPEPRVLDLAEAIRVAQHATTVDIADFIYVGIFTGMRRGEIIALRWENVRLQDRYIVVRRSGRRKRTKTKRIREVPIPLPLVPILERRQAEARSEWVFPNKAGKRLSPDYRINSRFRTALIRAGIIDGYRYTCVAPQVRAPGERNGRAKLTVAQVTELRGLFAKGTTQADLARRFMVSPRTVGMIVRGERWGAPSQPTSGCGHWEQHQERASRACPRCRAPLAVEPVASLHLFKDLRSSYLTHVVEQTGDLKVSQDLGGHASDRTTRRYYAAKRLEHLTNRVDEAFVGASVGPESSSGRFPVSGSEKLQSAAERSTYESHKGEAVQGTANGYEIAPDSAGLRAGLLSRGSQVRVLPGAPTYPPECFEEMPSPVRAAAPPRHGPSGHASVSIPGVTCPVAL